MNETTTMTVEQRVASAILERKLATIEIDGVKYDIAPPSVGTLILVSELASTLPVMPTVEKDKQVYAVLRFARDFKVIADIAATLILGANALTRIDEETLTERKWLLFKRTRTVRKTIDARAELADKILRYVSPSVLFQVIVKRLEDMEVGYFFGITTSLSEVNILKPTKEVEK